MSGHSKWHQIKHKKAVTDGRKSQLFARLSRDMVIAARAGRDPAQNPLLREAIARAKKANVPQDNITRILEAPLTEMHDVTYEGFGPGGVSLLVTSTTDNPNRTVATLRALFKEHGGSLGAPGSAAWKFTPLTLFTLTATAAREALTLQLIEAGASDIRETDGELIVSVLSAARAACAAVLHDVHHTVATTYVVDPTNYTVATSDERVACEALFSALREHLDVVEVASDLTPA